jgi:hypothetical protein
VDKARALDIAITAIFREILREEPGFVERVLAAPPPSEPQGPQPRFDFDESADTCTHGGVTIYKVDCPEHGPDGTGPAPTAEELDDMTSETHEEANPMIARARRIARQRERQAAEERVYAEDLPMGGMGPPPEEPPPLVV